MAHPELPLALAQAIALVREDRAHGASWLAVAALRALVRAAETSDECPAARLAEIERAARALASVRPSMAMLANMVAFVWHAAVSVPGADPADRLLALRAEAERLLNASTQAADRITSHVRPFLGGTVYTHSRSGTVEAVLYRLIEEAALHRFVVAESHPGGEGVVLARALAERGAEITLVADSACAFFMREASAVLVGADSVRSDGGVVNKIGTYPLVLSARAAGVPVFVLSETTKIAAPTFPLIIEEMDPAELLPEPAAHVTARNPYFEHTPAELFAAIVTEDGLLDRDAIRARAQRAGVALAFLQSASEQ
jgi:translation initiation factor 2B subunit (eIF-2B alpha/beta/delta family)